MAAHTETISEIIQNTQFTNTHVEHTHTPTVNESVPAKF